MRGQLPAAVLLFTLLAFVPQTSGKEDEAPPTPAERVGTLRGRCASIHVRVGTWAAGKKLGRAARAQYLMAIALDPDCRKARSKLGHRRTKDGAWSTAKEKSFSDVPAAAKRYREELARREAEALDDVIAQFEKLGLALIEEGEKDLGARLCLRVCLLAPRRDRAPRALGLGPLLKSFGTPEIATALNGAPAAKDAGIRGLMSSVIGIRSIVRRCGSAVAETTSDPASADKLARVAHQAQLLTTSRFGLSPMGLGWINVSAARSHEEYCRFLDSVGIFTEPTLTSLKQVGGVRGYRPRHFLLSYHGPMGSPDLCAPIFAHMTAENALFQHSGQSYAPWLFEAVGIDACLTILGVPGPPCVVIEQSSGLNLKEGFADPRGWGALLLRRVASGDVSRLESLFGFQIQALGPEDLILAHSVYRYLVLTRREGLGAYLRAPTDFASAFGMSVEDFEAEWKGVLLGGP